jgi:hypothetical protein
MRKGVRGQEHGSEDCYRMPTEEKRQEEDQERHGVPGLSARADQKRNVYFCVSLVNNFSVPTTWP